MNYGRSKDGSKQLAEGDKVYPSLFLDYYAVVEKIDCSLMSSNQQKGLKTVKFIYQNRAAPYLADTALDLNFFLKHTAMQLAQEFRREKWYVIIHPNHVPERLETTRDQRRRFRSDIKHSG